jgi:hypothetical protein
MGEAHGIRQRHIYCDTCRKWLRRPVVAGYAVIFCPFCDRCLDLPKSWRPKSDANPAPTPLATSFTADPLRVLSLPFPVADESVSTPSDDDFAGKVEVPGVLPEAHALGAILEVHQTPSPLRNFWVYLEPVAKLSPFSVIWHRTS